MNTPSAESLELAAAIEAQWPDFCLAAKPASLAIAELIDAKLQLPQRNAALLVAQGTTDIANRIDRETGCGLDALLEQIDELREALRQIKSSPLSALPSLGGGIPPS